MRTKVYSSFICFLKIVTDVQESSSLEHFTEMTNLSIASSKTCKPVIGNAYRWNDLSLAAVLETSLSKDCNLLNNISRLSIWIWRWEDISIM